METNPATIVLIVLVVILLFISIAFKIRADRKRKSHVNSSSEADKEYYLNKKRERDKKPNLWGIPSWGQALLAMFLTFVVLLVVGDIIGAIFKIREDSINSDALLYILYGIIIAIVCFFICLKDPGSVWYVPLLCNIVGIITLIAEPSYREGSIQFVLYGGWVLSVLASFLGARTGKNKLSHINN